MEELIVVKQLPIIEEKLKQLSKEIDEKVKNAMSLECSEDNKQFVKNERTALNNQFTELENQRKMVRNKVLEPYNAFENIYKTCVTEKFSKAKKDLDNKINAVEDEQKKRIRKEVEEYFIEYCKSKNIEFIKFENMNIKIGVSDKPTKLKKQVAEFIDKIEDDLKLIDTQEFKEEILIEYKKLLNVAQSITLVNDRHRELEEIKQQEEIKKEQKVEEQQKNEKVQSFVTPRIIKKEEIYTMTFTVTGTRNQLKQVKEFLENGGFKYE